MRRPYDLPPLTALAAFEAAARTGSMKAAAEELNVTSGAVSRQVKALEAEIGLALFQRVHRGLNLTAEGAELAEVLAQGFAGASAVCARLRRAGEGPSLTVGATTAFAGFWLIPRMGTFWQSHPGILVNHAVSDDPLDLRRGEADMAVRYGSGDWPGLAVETLFEDRLFPVCAPGLVPEGEAPASLPPAALIDFPLLRMTGVDPDWTDWPGFFEWAGIAPGEGLRKGRSLNNYTVVVQAARDGQGIALGWESLVTPLLQAGELVRVTDLVMPSAGAHYLTWPADRRLSPAMIAFRDWIRDQ